MIRTVGEVEIEEVAVVLQVEHGREVPLVV